MNDTTPPTSPWPSVRCCAGSLVFALGLPAAAAGECASIKPVIRSADGPIRLVVEHPRVLRHATRKAIAHWSACANYGRGFPAFVAAEPTGTGNARAITVRYARWSDDRRCGSFEGSTVTLYGSAFEPRRGRISCGSLAQNLAHELGHVLGLNDSRDRESCGFEIMAKIRPVNGYSRRVTPEECQAVGQRWLTAVEHDRARRLREGPSATAAVASLR